MVVITKYPNRRLYNTATSSYINLDEIQALIRDGLDVQIVESKTGLDVTTQMLLTRAVDAELLEMLVPGEFVQQLFRAGDRLAQQELILDRIFQAPSAAGTPEAESETIEDADITVTRVDVVAPESSEESSESSESDSDSEVTIVRVEAPPSEPAIELGDEPEDMESMDDFGDDVHISQVQLDDEESVDTQVSFTEPPADVAEITIERVTEVTEPEKPDSAEVDAGESVPELSDEPSAVDAIETVVSVEDAVDDVVDIVVDDMVNDADTPIADVPESSAESIPESQPEPESTSSKNDELRAKLEAMRARFKRP